LRALALQRAETGEHGRSGSQKREHPRRVPMGVVMMDGWQIAHHVFAGNRLDQTTVGEAVEDLHRRFGLRRVVIVGDHGMVTMSQRYVHPSRRVGRTRFREVGKLQSAPSEEGTGYRIGHISSKWHSEKSP